MDTLMTPEEVAQSLRISRRTVIVWLQSGKLPGIKVGNRWRVRADDLRSLVGPMSTDTGVEDAETDAWLGVDLSGLSGHEPYEWAPGELARGKPIRYQPGAGFIVEGKPGGR